MKRQGPRSAPAPRAGGASRIAAADVGERLSFEAAIAPLAAAMSLALEPIDRSQLRATGEDALADYVRRTFFHLPCAAPASAGTQRAAGPRARKATEAASVSVAMDDVAVYRERSSGLLQLLHHDLLLQFHPDLDVAGRRNFLARHDLVPKYNARLGAAQLVAHPRDPTCRGDALIAFADALGREPALVSAAPDFVSQFSRNARRSVAGQASDAQWHLALIGAEDAWVRTRGTADITIAVLDDGVDIDHPELSPNIHRRPVRGQKRDLYGRDFTLEPRAAGHYDPRPKAFDDDNGGTLWNDIHGTACAGVAAGTGPRAYGMAPKCRLLPVKIFRALPRHLDEDGVHAMARHSNVAAAIRYAALEAGADVLLCAWGGPDDLRRALAPALRDVREAGRKGKGAVVVCATGNHRKGEAGHAERRVRYPATDPTVIAVGASIDTETLADYSNTGPEVCVVAPSGSKERGIFTTDVSQRNRGYNPGETSMGGTDALFFNGFDGTSSASALAAGLCGLLLSLKPEMTPDDVRMLLASTAKKIGAASAYQTNGHSERYGHGRIDAAKAVAAANAWAPAAKTPAKKKTAKRRAPSKKA
jgi:subtilisin family serine protease